MGRGGGLAPPAKYWRPEAIEGIAHYSKMPAALFADVLGCPHPCAFGRPVKKAPPESPWPIVIFSHGLGGSADMYLQFCMHLASLGYIVFALEHEDRSGCHATTAAGEVHTPLLLPYLFPPAGFPPYLFPPASFLPLVGLLWQAPSGRLTLRTACLLTQVLGYR